MKVLIGDKFTLRKDRNIWLIILKRGYLNLDCKKILCCQFITKNYKGIISHGFIEERNLINNYELDTMDRFKRMTKNEHYGWTDL